MSLVKNHQTYWNRKIKKSRKLVLTNEDEFIKDKKNYKNKTKTNPQMGNISNRKSCLLFSKKVEVIFEGVVTKPYQFEQRV